MPRVAGCGLAVLHRRGLPVQEEPIMLARSRRRIPDQNCRCDGGPTRNWISSRMATDAGVLRLGEVEIEQDMIAVCQPAVRKGRWLRRSPGYCAKRVAPPEHSEGIFWPFPSRLHRAWRPGPNNGALGRWGVLAGLSALRRCDGRSAGPTNDLRLMLRALALGGRRHYLCPPRRLHAGAFRQWRACAAPDWTTFCPSRVPSCISRSEKHMAPKLRALVDHVPALGVRLTERPAPFGAHRLGTVRVSRADARYGRPGNPSAEQTKAQGAHPFVPAPIRKGPEGYWGCPLRCST